jgi:hypothetical protein
VINKNWSVRRNTFPLNPLRTFWYFCSSVVNRRSGTTYRSETSVTTSLRRATSRKCEDFIYTTTETWDHKKYFSIQYFPISERPLFLEGFQASFICPSGERWRVWSIGGMIVVGKNQSTWNETRHSATLSTTNLTWAGLGSNRSLQVDRRATNSMSNGTAFLKDVFI